MDVDTLLSLATRARGPLYARLLKAQIEIAKRGGKHAVPAAWLERLAQLDREYWAEQKRLCEAVKRFRKEMKG